MKTEAILNPNELHFSWCAVWAGLLGSTGFGALLSLLGLAIGAAILSPDAQGATIVGIGSMVWFIVGGIVTLWVGGAITGYFSMARSKLSGALHALVMWSLSFLVGLILSAYGAGILVAGAGQLIGNTVKVTNQLFVQTLPQQQDDELQDNVKDMFNELLSSSNDDSKNSIKNEDDILQALKKYVNNDDPNKDQQLKKVVINIITKNTSLSADEVDQKINDFQEKTAELTQEVTAQISKFAFFGFFIMLFGAASAILGGVYGASIRYKGK
jgi:hypothetical protein